MTITRYDYVRFTREVQDPKRPASKFHVVTEFSSLSGYEITRLGEALRVDGWEYPWSSVVAARLAPASLPAPLPTIPDEVTVVAVPTKKGRK